MKRSRTIDDYKRAGAWMRICKAVIARTYVECGSVLLEKDRRMFGTVSRRIASLCSRAEDNMFADYPELGNDALDTFYGAPHIEPRSETDAEQIRLMQSFVVDMFGINWDRGDR